MIDGADLRGLPLLERKRRLLAIMPAVECRALYLDHVAERGRDLFRVACERDLEGIVGKWAHGTYQIGGTTSWLKMKNPDYSQSVDRHELFQARRGRGTSGRSVVQRPSRWTPCSAPDSIGCQNGCQLGRRPS
jgi:bifunctional non-homologous end joining protein LigD